MMMFANRRDVLTSYAVMGLLSDYSEREILDQFQHEIRAERDHAHRAIEDAGIIACELKAQRAGLILSAEVFKFVSQWIHNQEEEEREAADRRRREAEEAARRYRPASSSRDPPPLLPPARPSEWEFDIAVELSKAGETGLMFIAQASADCEGRSEKEHSFRRGNCFAITQVDREGIWYGGHRCGDESMQFRWVYSSMVEEVHRI
jgi:hypothetical protein